MLPEKAISKGDAIAALADFRTAYRLITSLQETAMERWSNETPDEAFTYTGDELAQYEKARSHLILSLDRNPFNPVVHWLLANAYGELDKDFDRQLTFYNSALELDPIDDDVVVARLGMYMDVGRLDDAESDLEHLRKIESSHAEPMADHLQRARQATVEIDNVISRIRIAKPATLFTPVEPANVVSVAKRFRGMPADLMHLYLKYGCGRIGDPQYEIHCLLEPGEIFESNWASELPGILIVGHDGDGCYTAYDAANGWLMGTIDSNGHFEASDEFTSITDLLTDRFF